MSFHNNLAISSSCPTANLSIKDNNDAVVPNRTRKIETFPHHLMSEFERFIGHENFGFFLFLAFTIKAVRQCLITRTDPSESEILLSLGQRQGEDELMHTVRFIQSSLIPPLLDGDRKFIPNVHFVPRGEFKATDSLIDESIGILKSEFEKYMRWYSDAASSPSLVNSSGRALRIKRSKPNNNAKDGNKTTESEAIAVKYSKFQTDVLNNWMIEHKSHPFPSSTEIHELSMAAGLTYSQVVNWTTNVRKRNLKATVEKGKKPHHFLDFLFLADSREKRNGMPSLNTGARRGRPKNRINSRKARNVSSNTNMTHIDPDRTINTVSSEMEGLVVGTSNVHCTPKAEIESVDHFNPINFDAVTSPMPCFHPGFTLPKVTPPRGLYRSCDQRPLNNSSQAVLPMTDLPPVFEFLNWPTTEKIVIDDDTMLQEITKEGLVSTPQRRCSEDDVTISFYGSRLMEQISNIFREDECMNLMDVEDIDDQSLSVDDIDEIMGMEECSDDNVGDSDVMRLLEEHIINDIRYEV